MIDGVIEESDKGIYDTIMFFIGSENNEPCYVYVRWVSKWSDGEEASYLCEKINTGVSFIVKREGLKQGVSFDEYSIERKKWKIKEFKRAITRMETDIEENN